MGKPYDIMRSLAISRLIKQEILNKCDEIEQENDVNSPYSVEFILNFSENNDLREKALRIWNEAKEEMIKEIEAMKP